MDNQKHIKDNSFEDITSINVPEVCQTADEIIQTIYFRQKEYKEKVEQYFRIAIKKNPKLHIIPTEDFNIDLETFIKYISWMNNEEKTDEESFIFNTLVLTWLQYIQVQRKNIAWKKQVVPSSAISNLTLGSQSHEDIFNNTQSLDIKEPSQVIYYLRNMWITWLEIDNNIPKNMNYSENYFRNCWDLPIESKREIYAKIHGDASNYYTIFSLERSVESVWWNMIDFIQLYQTQILLNTDKEFLSLLIDKYSEETEGQYISKRALLSIQYEVNQIDDKFLSQLISDLDNVWMIHTAKNPLWFIVALQKHPEQALELLTSSIETPIFSQCNDPEWLLSIRNSNDKNIYAEMISNDLYKEYLTKAYNIKWIIDCYKINKDRLIDMLQDEDEKHIMLEANNPLALMRARKDHPESFSNAIQDPKW